MAEKHLVFNGIDGSTGAYLTPPLAPQAFWQAARRQTGWAATYASGLQTLSARRQAQSRPDQTLHAEDNLELFEEPSVPGAAGALRQESFSAAARDRSTAANPSAGGLELERLVTWRDSTSLAESGWGLILPRAAEPRLVEMILDALKPLLGLRQAQAGSLFKIFYRSGANLAGWKSVEGYRMRDSRDDFLRRHGAGGPGPANPALGVPYYLLIAADPQSIPFEFQFALDTQYAVGRIYFDTQADYARYAASVVCAETDPQVRLAPRAAFFGPANPNDQSTQLSAERLIAPLAAHVSAEAQLSLPGWQAQTPPPEDCTKTNLARLFAGGEHSPALLFTATHGIAWPAGDPRQFSSQGALVCQDWPGPGGRPDGRPGGPPLSEDAYFSAHDVPSDANLLGMMVFNFACYGAGTPQWDQFARGFGGIPNQIAPRAFLAALPQRLLSLERGGALAVIGHVERAWSYSYDWPGAGAQTEAFKSVLHSLMRGDPAGKALEDMNERYTQIAAALSSAIENDGQQAESDPEELAFLWTANNDARGYVLTGDPAVRLPATGAPTCRPQSAAVELHGELPSMLAPLPPSQPALAEVETGSTLEDILRALEAVTASQSAPYTSGEEVRSAVQLLRQQYSHLAGRLAALAGELDALEVKTHTGTIAVSSLGRDLLDNRAALFKTLAETLVNLRELP